MTKRLVEMDDELLVAAQRASGESTIKGTVIPDLIAAAVTEMEGSYRAALRRRLRHDRRYYRAAHRVGNATRFGITSSFACGREHFVKAVR